MLTVLNHASRRTFQAGLFGLHLIATTTGLATDRTWDGKGTGGNLNDWLRQQNWGNVAVPGATDNGVFTTVLPGNSTTPTLNGSASIQGIRYDAGAAAFTIGGTGTLTLGSNGITNNGSALQNINLGLALGASQTWNANAGILNLSSNLSLGANTLTFAGGFNITNSGVISGPGSLIQSGGGILNLIGVSPNSFNGGLTVNSGTVVAGKVNALGSGALTANGGTLNVGSFNQTVTTVTVAGGTINGTSGVITGSTFQAQSGTVNASLGGAASLTKSTSGTVTVTSSNVYSGGTTINAGKLLVNNTSGSGTGSGSVTITGSGTLGGTGSISGAVTNNSGGTLSAGNSVGQLNTGAEVWKGGSTILWEINDVNVGAGTGWDLLNISGGLDITATSGNKVFIDVRSLTLANAPGLVNDFDPSQNYIWVVAKTVSGISFAFGENENTVFELLLGGFSNGLSGGSFSVSVSNDGKDLNVGFTSVAVPEPSAWVLTLLGVGGLWLVRRNRSMRK